ncbi:hypothetical protein FCOIX_1752 [Fusarium coicis]|nr:hypothetical protein FCOIX_1752 [Fusarium coicis]
MGSNVPRGPLCGIYPCVSDASLLPIEIPIQRGSCCSSGTEYHGEIALTRGRKNETQDGVLKKQWPKEQHEDASMFVADGELPLQRKDQTVLSDAD